MEWSMVQKDSRRDAIRTLIRERQIRSYGQLAEELQAMGHRSADGTIARDMAEIGMSKVDGIYVLDTDIELRRVLPSLVEGCESAGNLVAVRTMRGVEQAVASTIEAARLPEVMCAAMGIGSVLVACRSDADASAFATLVDTLTR